MKLQRHNSANGGVLVVMLVISALVGIMLVAYLSMLSSQHRMSERSQVWNNTIVMSEIGIEEALAHINQVHATTDFATNNWTKVGVNFVRTRPNFINGGTIGITIDNQMPPTITSTGWLRAPLQTVTMKRVVRVKTRINLEYPDGILSKGPIATGGGGVMNSYNSTNNLFSSNGLYVASMASDHVTLATTSKTPGAIDIGNVDIYGNVATGAGGGYNIGNGSVGTTAWVNNSANDGKVEFGHSTDDVNVYIPDGVLPTDFNLGSATIPGFGSPGGTNYDYVLGNGDYKFPGNLPNGARIIVTGKARFWTQQPVSMSGQGFVYVATNANASLEWYSVQNISLGGIGVVNGSGLAKNFSIIGLSPTCMQVNLTGSSSFCGTVYAPSADIKLSGGTDCYGAFVGKSFQIQGNMSFHYDEALAGDPRKSRFVAVSWQEL